MITLLIESAARSLILFVAVFVLLRLLRIKHEKTQLLAWRGTLAAAFLMPVLLQVSVFSIPVGSMLEPTVISGETFERASSSDSLTGIFLIGYGIVATVLMLRLMIGLAMSWRLFRDAAPLQLSNVSNMKNRIRISASISAPATVGSTILLPSDYSTWSAYKLNAVLTHEASHASNGDFYWQAAVLLYRAVFWINPIAWWLPKHTSGLAESICDSASVRAVGNQIAYAELLVEFARKPAPPSLAMTMAGATDTAVRIARLLEVDIQRSMADRPRKSMLGYAAIAFATIVSCASCERQTVAPTSSIGGAEEPIVAARVNPDNKLSMPEYVASERTAEHEGTVFLVVLIDTDGRVSKSRVKKSSGFELLDREAEAHARGHWQFIPATQGGKPVDSWVTVPVKFELKKEDPKPNA